MDEQNSGWSDKHSGQNFKKSSTLINSTLDKIYKNSESGAAFSSLDILYKTGKKYIPSLKKSDVELFLKNKPSYVQYKRKLLKFPKRKFISFGPCQNISIDLMQLSEYEKTKNYPYTFIYVQSDIFSKLLKLLPLKSKSVKDIKEALHKAFRNYKPRSILTDKESAIWSKELRQYFKDENIKVFSQSASAYKNAQSESNIKYVRRLCYKLALETNNERFIDKLPTIEKIFNHHIVRTTGFSPKELHYNKDSIAIMQDKLLKSLQSDKKKQLAQKKSKNQSLALGDLVRFSVPTRNFAKEVEKVFSSSVHKIIFCKPSNPMTYFLFPPTPKKFYYKQELFKVDSNNIPKLSQPLERVLEKKLLQTGEILLKCSVVGSTKFEWLTIEELKQRYILFPPSLNDLREVTKAPSINVKSSILTRKQKKELADAKLGIHSRLRGSGETTKK